MMGEKICGVPYTIYWLVCCFSLCNNLFSNISWFVHFSLFAINDSLFFERDEYISSFPQYSLQLKYPTILSLRLYFAVVRSTVSKTRIPRFNSWLSFVLTMWPWASELIFCASVSLTEVKMMVSWFLLRTACNTIWPSYRAGHRKRHYVWVDFSVFQFLNILFLADYNLEHIQILSVLMALSL